MDCSAVILVKNEAYFLPYTLTQTEGIFDSYVIYDVGSTDGTRDIIQWWVEKMTGKVELFVRELPHVIPDVQGTFRNSMIAEGRRSFYYILDGDELYTQEDLKQLPYAVNEFHRINRDDPRRMFGKVQRVEVNADLTQQYVERRHHHRLYSKDAHWTGTHPGERSHYKQNDKSEVNFSDITCWHMHNTLRSPREEDATKRLQRKTQKTYHPGGELTDLNLLDELPMLRTSIDGWPVSPALAKLQEAYNG
jgi:hypothetical protein